MQRESEKGASAHVAVGEHFEETSCRCDGESTRVELYGYNFTGLGSISVTMEGDGYGPFF